MRARRQFALVYAFGVFLLFCLVGYNLNDGSPSVSWGAAGVVAGAGVALMIRRTTGE